MSSSAVALQFYDKDKKRGAIETIDRSLLAKGARVIIMPPRTLKVVAKDTDGKPLPSLRIGLDVFAGDSGIGSKVVATGANGEAVFDCVYTGGVYSAYVFSLEKGSYAPIGVMLPPVGSKGWTGRYDITVEPANRTQAGRVIDSEGNPVDGAEVHAIMDYSHKTTSGPDGRFILEGLPASKVKVYAQKEALHSETYTDKDTEELVITVRLHHADR